MIRQSYIFGLVVVAVFALSSCSEDPNSPGVEYMPDMYRSPALEAYVDYGNNKTMDWTQTRKDRNGIKPVLSRKPVANTIPHVGSAMAQFVMPYPLENTPEDYELSATKIVSPLKNTKENIEKGQKIYFHMCQHCHGETGKGDGKISQNGFIEGIPDYATKLKDLPEGKMYHTITYGKGLMGQHASQLTQLERWQVIEWVKCLQQGITSPEFDDNGMLKVSAESSTSSSSTN
jgi:mono/diheme cytochrome c family protein